MKDSSLNGVVCAFIYALLFTTPVGAANYPIDAMNITGGSVVWSLPGGLPEVDIFSSFGPDTNLVGGYIGTGGSTSLPFDPPNPDNILFFTFFDGLNDVATYTAASNLGTTSVPADITPGGPVPTGTLDDTLNTIEMDLSSWFGSINNATDVWAGTGLDDGFTSPLATGTWNPVTYEYELTWNSRTPDSPTNPFPGLESQWTLTGYAYPVVIVSITIDVKPGSNINPVNIFSKGKLTVAILTTDDFDASMVDVNTVQFGPGFAAPSKYRLDDVDGDGDWDMKLKFKTQETGIACGETEVTLTGETFDGQSFAGMDSIRTVDCELTFTPVQWTIARDTDGAGIHTIFMITDVSPLVVDDLQDIGGELIWEETQITLCADPSYPPVQWGKFISIRDVGDGFLRIGDGFQSNGQGTGCDINTTMQNAFDDFGLPKNACLSVRSGNTNHEFCAPLNVIQ